MNNTIVIIAQESADRIDALLAQNVPGLTRSAAQRLLDAGAVSVDGRTVKKNYKCSAGERIELSLPETQETELSPQDIPLDIVYEDEDVVVVNKPRGMVVHPAPGHPDGTLVNALMHHCGDSLSGVGGEKRPGIVHRIDKDTSGLLIAAKNDNAHLKLSAQLSDRSLSRVYEAVVRGSFREDRGTVDAPVGRHPTDRKKMAVTDKNSRAAVTHWEVIARYRGYTHIRCRLETGRTHQIRVHMEYLGYPLVGDPKYSPMKTPFSIQGQALHSQTLEFTHPRTGERLSFEAPLPEDMHKIVTRLRLGQFN